MTNKKPLIVNMAYFLESSIKYQDSKHFFYNLLENERYKYNRYFNIFMIIVVFLSVTSLVVDVRYDTPLWLNNFDLYFVTIVFIVEYLLRIWVYSDIHKIIIEKYEESIFFDKKFSFFMLYFKIFLNKWKYISSLPAIIDFLAILPSYRSIRTLRVLILFRAFKMLRYTKSLTGFLYVLKRKKNELITIATLAGFFIFITGIMIYVIEGNKNPHIHNLFDAFYWALITISTVGYGDIVPVTPQGRAVSMLIIVTGIGLIAFITSIIVSAFNEKLSSLKNDKTVRDAEKKNSLTIICGYGLLGRLVAKGLAQNGVEFIILDKKESLITLADDDGYSAICADATRSEIFIKLGIYGRIKHVLCLTSDDIQNTFIAVNIKSLNPNILVTARCSDEKIAQKLAFAKIDHVIMPEEIASMMGAVYAGEPVAFEVLLSIIEQKNRGQIDEINVSKSGFLDGKSIKEIDFIKLRLILFGVFRKNNKLTKLGDFIFNPQDEYVLNHGDKLVCIGYKIAIANLKRMM